MALENGTELLHYRVVEKIGEGGMGSVYRASDSKLNREIALKVLPREMAADPSRLERFRREARAVAALNHPHIVTLFSVEQAGDTHFLTMELVEGKSLDRILQPGGLPLAQVFDIGEALADALASAHEKGIVHRDLKPANVVISTDSRVKVLDFGLAKLAEDDSAEPRVGDPDTAATVAAPLTQPGMVMGTAPYMSPEQLEGKQVDQRTDIFALGVMLYEMCSGTRPFKGENPASLISSILRDAPQPVTELRQDIPRHLGRIVDHCLQKSATDRYQSVLDVRNELRGLRREVDSGGWASGSVPSVAAVGGSGSSLPGASIPPSFVSSPGGGQLPEDSDAPSTSKNLILILSVFGLAALAFGAYSFWGRPEPTPDFVSAPQPVTISTLMSRDNLLAATLSPDGRYLAYVTSSPPTFDFTVRQVRTGSDIDIITGSPRPIRGIRFSSDGDYLFFTNRDPKLPNYNALFQVPSLGGEARKIAFDVDSAPAFAPDGSRFVFRRGVLDQNADSLVVASLNGEEEQELARVQSPQRYKGDPAWSPDGRHVAIGSQTADDGVRSWIEIVDVSDGANTVVGDKAWLDIDSVVWRASGESLLAIAFAFGDGSGPQVYHVPFPDGPIHRVTSDMDAYSNLSMSSDGETLAAVRQAQVTNVWFAPASGEATPITFAAGSKDAVQGIAPLPGAKVAFTAPQDMSIVLWSMDADGTNRRQLTTSDAFVFGPQSQAGAGVVYNLAAEEDTDEFTMHVWRWTPDGGSTQLTQGSGESLLALSQAGNAILYNSLASSGSLQVLKLDGSEPYALTSDAQTLDGATFAPDGQSVLMTLLEGERPALYPQRYIFPLEGGDPIASFRLPPGAIDIQFVPGQEDLTYLDRGTQWSLMRWSLAEGQAKPVMRFEDGQIVDYNWHRDGSRILLHHRSGRTDSLWELQVGEPEPRKILEFKTGRIYHHHWAPDRADFYFTYGTVSQDVVLIEM